MNRTFLVGGDQAEGDGQVRLARAARAEQHDVLGALDEPESGEFQDLLTRRAGREGEVVGLERLERRKARRPCQHRPCPHAPGVALGLEDLLQEVGVARILAPRCALRDGAIEIGQRTESQLLGQRYDALMLEGARATSPSISSS